MKWFDLSRFGAKLSVLPKSEARLHSVLRLEMRNSIDWGAQRIIASAYDPDAEEKFSQKNFFDNLKAIGFGEMKATRLASVNKEDFDNFGVEYPTYATEALRSSIKLSELQTVMPGLTQLDVVDMPLEKVIVGSEDFLGNEAKWEHLRKAMVNDSIGNWVANKNPWDSGDKPKPIMQAMEDAGLGFDREDRDRSIPASLAAYANRLGYRDDALVTYYVNEAAALADGLKEGEYHRAGFAASVPLMVAGEGKVVALRNIWDMPDLRRTLSPEVALWLPSNRLPQVKSLVTDYLREKIEFRDTVNSSMARLDEWIANPNIIKDESPDLIWGQVAVFSHGYALQERYANLANVAFGDLEVTLERNESQNWRLKKLNSIGNDGFEILANAADKSGAGPKEKVLDTLLSARLLWQKMLNAEVAAERNAALAAAPSAPIKTDADSLNVDASDKRKHVDVGEKIGGARKDFAKRGMMIDDLSSMNDTEIKLHVNKQNIWPPLNYAQMMEDGIDAKVAMAVKLVKDSINTVPHKSYGEDERDCANKYVEVIGAVREFFEGVSNEDDFKRAVKRTTEYASQGDENLIYGGEIWEQLGRNSSKLLNYNPLYKAQQKIARATRSYDSSKMAYVYADPWEALVKTKKSSSEADIAERKRKSELDKELHVPHLQHVRRTGEDWRAGMDVTAEKLLEDFGFRGIEYGEWLPQKERQEVINMAYDSFADLAQALNLTPKDVSLGGELAVAFGARGTGGRGAALAHFEPARFVMNMTRMKGAGSLAHEWMHAFDRKMALDLGTGQLFASEATTSHLKSLGVLAHRLKIRAATQDEILEAATKGAARSRSNAESWMGGLDVERRSEGLADLKAALEDVRYKISGRVERMLEGKQSINHISNSGVLDSTALHDFAQSVRGEIVSKWRGQLGKDAPKAIEGNVWHFAKHEGLAQTMQLMIEKKIALPDSAIGYEDLRRPSVFSKDAQELDKLRSGSYWDTTRELFARAGAAYVQDKIEELGGRSDYLVYGAGEGRSVEGMTVSPNPRGEDRVALNASFDALLDEYRATLKHEVAVTADMSP